MRSQWTSFSATWECPGPSLCHLYRLAELPTTRKSPLAQNARSQDVRNQSWRHVLCAGTITPKICIWRSPKTGPARVSCQTILIPLMSKRHRGPVCQQALCDKLSVILVFCLFFYTNVLTMNVSRLSVLDAVP